MVMQNFDPAVAHRVWQRVQAANEEKCTERPACPIEGIPTVPAVPPKSQPRRPIRKIENCGAFPLWLIVLLLCM